MKAPALWIFALLCLGEAHSAAPVPDSERVRQALPLYKTIPAAQDSDLTPASSETNGDYRGWSRSQADAANTRYSALTQITRSNVAQLQLAWVYRSGDGPGNLEASPVIIDGVMYGPTVGNSIAAVDAATGTERWRYQPPVCGLFVDPVRQKYVDVKPGESPPPGYQSIGFGIAHRGLTYWHGNASQGPRLFFMANGYLFALDPKLGRPVETFGDRGKSPSSKGAGTSSFLGAVAPVVYESIVVAPNQNMIDAFDAVTGARLWSFDTLQYPVPDPNDDNGGNVWGGLAMDMVRGIVYVATGDPHPNFVGVDRPGPNHYATSVIALDAKNGKLRWAFQEIEHNLWDLDTPAPPNLVTITHNGKRVDAVAAVTKLGNTLLLDRLTGKPLFPYRLRRAPASTIPGEITAPYQPALELPQPFARQSFTADDVTNISSDAHEFILRKVRQSHYGWFEPIHLDAPTIFYGVHGGAEWTGAAFDPGTGYLYVSANQIAWVEQLSRAAARAPNSAGHSPSRGEGVFLQTCAACHGERRQGKGVAPSLMGVDKHLTEEQVRNVLKYGRNGMPPMPVVGDDLRDLLEFLFEKDAARQNMVADAAHATYESSDFIKLLDEQGYPGTKPPWGTLNAIDLNTGKLAWQVPLGEYHELTKKGVPKTGTENFGGATITAGGLVFCAGTRDRKIRAFDKTTGRELWQYTLPYGGYAPPAVYEVNGREYVVIAATSGGKLGGEPGDAYIAFAIPDSAQAQLEPGLTKEQFSNELK